MSESRIQGLKIKPLVRHSDERGDFRELVRATEPGFQGFQQLSSSVVYEGIAKAWHLHWDQTESMSALSGIVKFAFADRRKESPSFGNVEDHLVDTSVNPLWFTVPPGIAHGYRIVRGPAVICYLANRIYDPKDQIKIPHDDREIGYDWGPPRIV
ncbi:MAG: dTDP-4-dehydrorhamnose 3,5-epimerase family protein [Bdellovibrionota bacterium]